ncbi:MAG TPA: hypothetical protein VKH42_09910 [Vicinamibacterales bacterium]|nr:hypothetical protein [Vicinamibacterales bacterium]
MKRFISIVAVLIAATPIAGRVASAQTNEQKVAEAVKPLPDDLKAGATVVTYDAKTGARQVLRQGTNFIECQPTMADGFIRCYNKVMTPRRDMEAKLHAQGMKDEDVTKEIQAATKDGRLKPPPFGTVSYRYSDDPGRIKLLWVISVPNATPEMLGISTESQRDAALKGNGKPWMMLPGTPGAHIMIPINPGPNTGTK